MLSNATLIASFLEVGQLLLMTQPKLEGQYLWQQNRIEGIRKAVEKD